MPSVDDKAEDAKERPTPRSRWWGVLRSLGGSERRAAGFTMPAMRRGIMLGVGAAAVGVVLSRWQERADTRRWGPPADGWRDVTAPPLVEYGYDE